MGSRSNRETAFRNPDWTAPVDVGGTHRPLTEPVGFSVACLGFGLLAQLFTHEHTSLAPLRVLSNSRGRFSMPRIHPDELTLRSLVDSLRGAGLDRALAHLTSCRDCQTRARALTRGPVGSDRIDGHERRGGRVLAWPAGVDYASVLWRGSHQLLKRAASFEHERADAAACWKALAGLPWAEIEQALERDARCRSWGFVETLLEASRERLAGEPEMAERLAHLARLQVDRLDATFYGTARLADLAARCLGRIAYASQEQRDLDRAERCFADAEGLLRSGTRDPLERAELWNLKSALLRRQGRATEAEHFLVRAFEIFRSGGEEHRAGRCQVALADLSRQADDRGRAIERLRFALPLLDPNLEPGLGLVVRHNLIAMLAEAGLYLAGRRMLAESRPAYKRFPHPPVESRRLWIEGRIAQGLGQLASAERALRLAHEALEREGLQREAAQVGLELADVLLRQNRSREAGDLAEKADAFLRSIGRSNDSSRPAPSPDLPFPGLGRSALEQPAR